MIKISYFLIVFAFSAIASAQTCHFDKVDGNDSSADGVRLSSETVVIVTHSSSFFDGRKSAEVGTNSVVAYAKKNHFPVIYLLWGLSDEEQAYNYIRDCNPNYVVSSSDGDFVFKVPGHHVISVGGHWQACQKDTMLSLLEQWSQKAGHYRITYVMDGIYIFPQSANSQDPYYQKMVNFLQKAAPQMPEYKRKLNLLEMQSLIGSESLFIDFLKRMTPPRSIVPGPFDPIKDIPENFELRLEVNGRDQGVLRAGTDPAHASIVFSYVDSLRP